MTPTRAVPPLAGPEAGEGVACWLCAAPAAEGMGCCSACWEAAQAEQAARGLEPLGTVLAAIAGAMVARGREASA